MNKTLDSNINKMTSPLVSIVLPSYNGEDYISFSIESVLAQSYQNWELIIVNDCSNDKTLSIAEKYASIDSRIRVISNSKNKKLPESLNVGFRNAKGKYYTWTSDDNMYKPNAIEIMVKYLNEHPNTDLISYAFEYVTEEREFIRAAYSKCTRYYYDLPRACNIGAAFMYRREIAQKVGKYNKKMFCAEDYDYWCRIAIAGNIEYQKEILYSYMANSKSLTATKQDIVQKRTLEIRLKYTVPILKKAGFSKKEIIDKIMEYDKETPDKRWINEAKKVDFWAINSYLAKKWWVQYYPIIYKVIQNIFSVTNKGNKKVIRLIGFKITFNKKKIKKY